MFQRLEGDIYCELVVNLGPRILAIAKFSLIPSELKIEYAQLAIYF